MPSAQPSHTHTHTHSPRCAWRPMCVFKVYTPLCFCVCSVFLVVMSLSCLSNEKIDKTHTHTHTHMQAKTFLPRGIPRLEEQLFHWNSTLPVSKKSGILGSHVAFWTGSFPRLAVGGGRGGEMRGNHRRLWILMVRRVEKGGEETRRDLILFREIKIRSIELKKKTELIAKIH